MTVAQEERKACRLFSLSINSFVVSCNADLEQVLERIPDVVEMSRNQRGFVANRGTIDAVYSIRLLPEKH